MSDIIAWYALACALGVVLYVYAGYPLLLGIFRPLAKRHRLGDFQPSVTLIVPAYNEAAVIRAKLENSLAIDYPKDKLEIIVASDGCSDGTNDIVREYADRGIKLLDYSPRAGKISALNRSVPEASGELVVLCDANVMFHADAVCRLVRHFADPSIGAVTGDVRIRSEDAPFGEGEGLYYKYERFIQLQESSLGSIIGVDGGMYALRKDLFRPLPADTILDDFIISMNVALAGRRVLYDPEAVATENATMDIRQEFRRKVRITAGGFRELLRGQGVPGLRQVQLFWSYMSHKLLRWLVPWFLIIIAVANIVLVAGQAPGTIPAALLTAQGVFYGCAVIGCLRPNARWPAVIGVPFYFCMVNGAAWLGCLRGLGGIEQVTWRKADRGSVTPLQ